MARTLFRDSGGRFVSAGSTSRATPATMEELAQAGVYAADIEGWIVASAVVHVAKLAKAEEIKEYWRSIAPEWGDKDPRGARPPTAYGTNEPVDYRNSIQVREEDGRVSVGTDFMPLAGWLEYGSKHNPEHGYGARALAHFGGGPVDSAARLTDRLFVG